jgi:hypothetical protein
VDGVARPLADTLSVWSLDGDFCSACVGWAADIARVGVVGPLLFESASVSFLSRSIEADPEKSPPISLEGNCAADGELGVVEEARPLGLDKWFARTLDVVTMLERGDARVALRPLSCAISDNAFAGWAEGDLGMGEPSAVPISKSPDASLSFTPLSDGVWEQGGVG